MVAVSLTVVPQFGGQYTESIMVAVSLTVVPQSGGQHTESTGIYYQYIVLDTFLHLGYHRGNALSEHHMRV
jgi:hypothetical protein